MFELSKNLRNKEQKVKPRIFRLAIPVHRSKFIKYQYLLDFTIILSTLEPYLAQLFLKSLQKIQKNLFYLLIIFTGIEQYSKISSKAAAAYNNSFSF